MTNAEKRRQYFKKYYQTHKEQCLERYRRNYQRRKELGIEVGETDIYHNRQELQEAEAREEGKINWDAWDRIVEQTKQDIAKELENYKAPNNNRNRKPIYVYTLTSHIPLFKFENSDEAAETLGIPRMIITNHARLLKPLYNKGLYITYQPI